MNIFRKLFKHEHNWQIKERSNVIQYDNMGYSLRLFLMKCSKCNQTRQEWIDSYVCNNDVVCKWEEDNIPASPKVEEKL